MAAARRSTIARYMRTLYGRRIVRSTRSLPLCSGTWKCGAIAGAPVNTSKSSSVKYAGSTDDSRSQRSPRISISARTSAASEVRGTRSAP